MTINPSTIINAWENKTYSATHTKKNYKMYKKNLQTNKKREKNKKQITRKTIILINNNLRASKHN